MIRYLLSTIAVILAIVWLSNLSQGLFDSPATQRDFRTYHTSAKMFRDGGDPYNYSEIIRYANDTSMWRYMYPPQTLPIMRAIFLIPGSSSRFGYFLLQIIAILVLLWLWGKYFVRHPFAIPLLVLFVVFAFRGAAGVDITVGNINLIDGCVVWSAFVAYLHRRYGLFVALIFLSAIFKNVEILFLGLLLFEKEKLAYKYLGIGVVSFAIFHAIGFIVYPAFYHEWLHNLNTNNEWGALNPAILPAIDGAFFNLCHRLGFEHPWRYSAVAIYLVFAITLPIASWSMLRNVDLTKQRLPLMMLAIFGYTILLPRFKDYSYVLLIAPAAWIVLCGIKSNYLKSFAIVAVTVPVFAYQPLAVVMLFYGYLIYSLHTARA